MHAITLSPTSSSVQASVTVPGSKSYTNRALLLASLCSGVSRLSNASLSSDSDAMVAALQKVGVSVHQSSKNGQPTLIVEGRGGRFIPFEGTVDIGPAGTTMRFLTALFASIPGNRIILQGSKRMHERPIRELVHALQCSGAAIQYLQQEGCPPLLIESCEALAGGKVEIDSAESSQFVSSLLLSAILRREALTIHIRGESTSRSYVEMTLQSLRDFGITFNIEDERSYYIPGNQSVKVCDYAVEGDASGASYLWGVAAVSGGSVTVHNVNPHSAQGDIAFPTILERMGCRVTASPRSITVSAPTTLSAVEVDMSNMPDTAQTLAVIAACARGTTVIRGLHTLRIKETDRIAALHTELGKVGIRSEPGEDYLVVHGGNPHYAQISTYDDHRMAMSFAILGARKQGITIVEPNVVDKSFKSFWSILGQMGIALT